MAARPDRPRDLSHVSPLRADVGPKCDSPESEAMTTYLMPGCVVKLGTAALRTSPENVGEMPLLRPNSPPQSGGAQ